MKKMAFFLALFVGLNAGAIARKPEEEEGQVIVIKDSARHSTAAWIHRIAKNLRACYYGITKDGFIQELSWDFIHKMQKRQIDQDQISIQESHNSFNIKSKGKFVWINYSHEIKNEKESLKFDFLIKKNSKGIDFV